jgi:AcrR family transcriptional regulator
MNANIVNKEEEVKEMILAAARKVFQKWGLNKTTMEDIAHEAGKGKSTLYYYFKSKEDIFEAIALGEMDAILSKTSTIIAGLSSAKEKLRKHIQITLVEIKNTINIYPIVRGEIKGNKEFIQRIKDKMNTRDEKVIQEILRFGIKNDEIRFVNESDIEKTASVINGLISAMISYLIIENEDNEKIDIALRLITEGM